MVIFDCKPNGHGPEEYFMYSGDLASITKMPSDQRQNAVTNGWLLTANALWSKKLRFVVYGKEDKLFLHAVDGVFNCSSADTVIELRRFLNFSVVKIYVQSVLKARYVVYTPIVRLIMNDGMFPSDSEPLLEALTRIADPAEHSRLAGLLSAGIAAPEEVLTSAETAADD